MLYKRNQTHYPASVIYGAMSERSIYKTSKRFNLPRRQLVTLLQCYEIQRNLNVLLSVSLLKPISIASDNSLYNYFSILRERGYLEQVLGKFNRKDSKSKNRLFNVTLEGNAVCKFFSRSLKSDLKRLDEMGDWRKVNKRAVTHYEALGLFNPKR